MKTTHEVFKEILTETGFGNYKPSEMSNSDYWMCTQKAMERYAKDYANNQIEKICDSDNLDKIIHSKSLAEARRTIRTLIQPE